MNRRAQSVTEYGVLIALVALAATGMSVYWKRGVQGITKMTEDDLGKHAEEEYTYWTGKSSPRYQVIGDGEFGMLQGTMEDQPLYQYQTVSRDHTGDSNTRDRFYESGVGTHVDVTGTYLTESANGFGFDERAKPKDDDTTKPQTPQVPR